MSLMNLSLPKVIYNRSNHQSQVLYKNFPLKLKIKMDEQDQFQQLFELQLLYLNQQIAKQLQQRNLTEPGLSNLYINFCKQSNSDEDFQNKIFAQNPNTIISKHFLTSLYHTIKQKLPRKPNLNPDDDIKSQDQFKQLKIEHQHSSSKNQPDFYHHQQKLGWSKLDKHSFPGLSLPNNDEIDLDLDLDQPIVEKIDQIKKLQSHNQRSDVQENEKYQSIRQKQRHHRDRSRSHSYEHEKKRSYSQQSRDRSRKKDKKHKEKKEKKDKKHKKGKHRGYSQDSRSPQRQRIHEKPRDNDKFRSDDRKDDYKRKEYPKIQQTQVKEIKEGLILRGKVRKVDKFGCIVNLLNTEEPKIATLHAKEIRQNFEGDPQEIIKADEKVWVKVIGVLEGRIRVSMKGINQFDGRDSNAKQQQKDEKAQNNKKKDIPENMRGTITGIKITEQDELNDQGEGTTYGEMWELSRLGYMGKGPKVKHTTKQDIQEVNIECDDRQPPFLRGQTTKAGINLSPVRIVKNPEGTLQRQAENAVQYAKERREIREKTKNQARGEMTKVLDEVIPDHSSMKKGSKRSSLTIKQQRQSLPIFNYRQQLIKACMDNRILIVIGQTGSGKTTQITQYLHQAGLTRKGKIGCTQPRRVAAMSVAKRVCEQMGVTLGEEVGYSIRFEDYTSSRTIIKYMTDGMLLREALLDKYLSQYSVIMLDEAHERTIHTDVLFGILKNVAQKRKDFTLIVTSATLEAKKFSSYFFDCKIFSIPGRTYNVEILYAKQPQTDYLDAALMCVLQIHIDEPPGDILLFLTGQQEIDTACQVLNQRMKKLGSQAPELIVLPVYSALPSELQSKIFDPAPRGKRKCVIATNIAEASLTIDGIYYVVDPGFSKVKIYNSKLGMDTLVVAPISQASAKQRAGRAGRTGPGKCYRLYTEEAYQAQMLPTSIPEIQRANLSNTVLELKAMGINDLINFDFMDPPPVQTLIAALQQLYYLSALDDEGLLTKLGRKMAEFPLEPPLSKMLLTSIDFGCTEQIATIISLLSVQNIFYRPKEKEVQADQKKTKFLSSQGDHLTFLSIFDGWKKSGFSQSWCHENYIQLRSLKRAMDVKKQIIDLLQRYRFKILSCNGNTTLIRKTIVSGFFFHAAKKDSKGGYRTLVDDHQVYIHPSSSLFNKQPQWVIYHQLIFTSKQYMRDVCAINPKWLIDVAPNFFKFTDELGFTRKKRNQKLDPLNQKYGDPNAWRLSKRRG